MSQKLHRIISNSSDWQSLRKALSSLSKKEKGDVFELFIKYFLQSHPDYASTLKQVWLFSELTPKKKQELKIPSNDQGIDLVAQTTSGDYWAIQCKYLEDENQRLSHDYISTFGNLAFAISGKFTFGLVCTTAERFSKAYIGQKAISFCTSEAWQSLTLEQFNNIRNLSIHKPIILSPYKPFLHQQRAIKNAVNHFITNKQSRGKLILPCGSGKSLTGFWIAEKLNARKVIIAVPSLALVSATLKTWLREAVANKMNMEWICVCSDESIGKQDDVAVLVQDLGIPCLTDVDIISKWLARKTRKTKVVFTTYQSGKVIAAGAVRATITFDLGIMDEAHRTVGQKDKMFSHLLHDENIRIDKRVFMTATERRYLGSSDEITSMDNPAIYGETFELLSFKEALEIKLPILSDYRIITVIIDQKEVRELIRKNAYIRPTKGNWNDEVEAHTLTSIIALRKAMQKYPIKHAVSFHSSIARAKAFEENQARITEAIHDFEPIDSFHVTGAISTAERSKTINAFIQSPKALITNSRCLTEGVDVPSIDCVLFADPKRSTIDIVQAVGRLLRISKGKQYGYVIIPVLSKGNDLEPMIDDESYNDLLLTLRALASNDDRIIEYFKPKGEKDLSKDKRLNGDELIEIYAEQIDLQQLANNVELKLWSRLAKLNWMPFYEARSFIHTLKLKSKTEWERYYKSKYKPFDIPSSPSVVYKNYGWNGFGDWLGTGVKATFEREYLSFVKAREFVRSLKIVDQKQWKQYCKSPNKPKDIPNSPHTVYRNQGWISTGDWLGTGSIAGTRRQYLSFKEAREFVRLLKLKGSSDWHKFTKSDKRPLNIPSHPHVVYKGKGWINMGDWLGTGSIAPQLRVYRPFNEAREFVHSLNLKDRKEWQQYCKSGKKPNDIPFNPERAYKNKGWKGVGDWLGTGVVASQLRTYRPFHEARAFVHSLKLQNGEQWKRYKKSGKKPYDIPFAPHSAYKGKGWKSMGDWLGTGTVASQFKTYLSFDEARNFIHSLKLKKTDEWIEYKKSGNKPEFIPAAPERIYKTKGWKGIGDWLGTGVIANKFIPYRSFKEAREFARSLNLKKGKEWKRYCESGKKPNDIPAYPDQTYKNKGWISWGDWLGNNFIAPKLRTHRSFIQARRFVHSLQLRSVTNWKGYCKSDKKPKDIPTHPDRVYKNKEWISWGDWLGTGTVADIFKNYKPFDEARSFVHSLKIKGQSEWRQYCQSGKKPEDIPAAPYRTYKNNGWKGFGDWTGTEFISNKMKEYRSFIDARKYVHSLKLKSNTEWYLFCKSGNRPKDIPTNPNRTYKNKGWISMSDWLGKGFDLK